ncbi:MAG: hypothetical protein IAE88_04285 [Rhodobacteraceae bacterium]|uniref:hypothetical protein n=1 Tax=Accumulibacter sp. TaxID=2053492 RepID=UPI001A0BB1A9|nr:hypothetical protein [Accumulibacter sp.]MBE2258050.1 hypothetical protein [Paracoccaceae bacterium]MCB1940626.1 hypothetical protein [Accumulibacter sp.]
MILNLFAQRPDHPLADAKELKRILADLHVDKAAKAVDELRGWFETLRHAEHFRLDHFFDVLRQLDEAAQPHLRNLVRDYLQSPRLSKLEEERQWARSYGYWDDVAALYDSCVERARLDPKSKGSDAFKASLPLAVVRSQAARCIQLKWLAYRYATAAEDLWKFLGSGYMAAEAAASAQKPVPLYPAQRGLASVAQQYLHAVVFATSSMDSLTPLQIELADRLIAHFLPYFVISPDCRPDSVYWVDAVTGSLPLRLARHPGPARPGLRFFSPGTAPQALDDLIHLVERGETPADLNLGGGYPQKVLLPVLRHLRVYWAWQPPQRQHRRHPVKTRMLVLRGFDESYTVFSGARQSPAQAPGSESWLVENISLGGFHAVLDDAPGERVKLGALLCAQPEGGDNWLLGVARRFNRLGGQRASLGVQVLSRNALSIELRPRRSGFSAAIAIPAIWLRDGGDAGVERILLPIGGFNVREAVEFQHQNRLLSLTPVELVETGSDYEIGRFHSQSPLTV